MSGIVGIFDRRGRPVDASIAARMLDAQGALGRTSSILTPRPDAVLAVARHDWECEPGLAGNARVHEEGDLVVVSDASIYYRRDLRDRLAARRERATGDSPAELIAAAYRVWGEGCAERLEGDFAFVVHDRRRNTVFAARDLGGRRPLFFAELDGALVIASTVGAILAHPSCPAELNLAVIGATAANQPWACGSETCWSAIRVVPMASSLACDERLRLWRHWSPEAAAPGPQLPSDQAAAELRETLSQAVFERTLPDRATAVWMSGGRDSTAIFGAGQHAIRRHGGDRRLVPVSVDYPEDDLGHENPYIEAIAEAWDVPVHWVPIGGIPLFHRDAERAAARDEPATSPYENWNVALARAARATGARVAMDGNGGDQLFGGTTVYLADMLRRGHLLSLARDLRSRGKAKLGRMVPASIEPLLAPPVLAAADRLRGRTPRRHYMERALPPWIRPGFVRRFGLLERERAVLPRRVDDGLDLVRTELRWTLTLPVVGYMQGLLQPRFLEEGVQLCSPLMDRRVVELAFFRPATDRISATDTKMLLRQAMRGLLPDRVLARRRFRTGTTLTYSRRSMQEGLPGLYERLFESPLVLADLGIVDPGVLGKAVAEYRENGGDTVRIDLFHTLQAELWLRGHPAVRTVET